MGLTIIGDERIPIRRVEPVVRRTSCSQRSQTNDEITSRASLYVHRAQQKPDILLRACQHRDDVAKRDVAWQNTFYHLCPSRRTSLDDGAMASVRGASTLADALLRSGRFSALKLFGGDRRSG